MIVIMENASKALLIVGGVLIAILLLTVFSYLFQKMALSTSSIYQTIEQNEIAEFNQQFLNYEGRGTKKIGTKKDERGADVDVYNTLAPQDVATLINLARDAKSKSKIDVAIKMVRGGSSTDISSEDSSEWLKNNINSGKEYKCKEVHINSDTLLVYEVILSEM